MFTAFNDNSGGSGGNSRGGAFAKVVRDRAVGHNRLAEDRTVQIGPDQVCFAEVGAGEVSVTKINTTEVGTLKVCIL